MDFYNEKKWCNKCKKYVRYMMSTQFSYCSECGEQVSLFNRKDSEEILKIVQRNKYKAC